MCKPAVAVARMRRAAVVENVRTAQAIFIEQTTATTPFFVFTNATDWSGSRVQSTKLWHEEHLLFYTCKTGFCSGNVGWEKDDGSAKAGYCDTCGAFHMWCHRCNQVLSY